MEITKINGPLFTLIGAKERTHQHSSRSHTHTHTSARQLLTCANVTRPMSMILKYENTARDSHCGREHRQQRKSSNKQQSETNNNQRIRQSGQANDVDFIEETSKYEMVCLLFDFLSSLI